MRNSNFNSNIELASRSNGANPTPSRLHNLNYQPQIDEDDEVQSPPAQPQRSPPSSLEGQFEACVHKLFNVDKDKAVKIAFLLIVLLQILDVWPLYTFMEYMNISGSYTEDIRGVLDSMSANLKRDPIIDIKLVGKGAICPIGFEPLKLGVWPGTKAACMCESKEWFASSCKEVDAENCEEDIPSTFPIEIQEWDGSIWCEKRAVLGVDYIRKAECSIGYKECYNGGCFNENCPITKVEISSDKGELVLTRTQRELPLVNIHISPNDIPCFNEALNAKSTSSSSYVLLKRKESGCDEYGLDSQFSTKLDSKSIFDAYTQYSFKYVAANLPYFEDQSKKSMSFLSARTRMKTVKNDFCLEIDEKLIGDSAKAFEKSVPFLAMTVNALMFRIFMLPFAAIMRCCMGRREFWGGVSFTSKKMFGTLLTWNSQLIVVVYRIVYSYQELRAAEEQFERYDSLGCFGEGQGSMVVRDYLEILRQGEMNCLLYFGFLGSFCLSVFISLWYFMVKKVSSSSP